MHFSLQILLPVWLLHSWAKSFHHLQNKISITKYYLLQRLNLWFLNCPAALISSAETGGEMSPMQWLFNICKLLYFSMFLFCILLPSVITRVRWVVFHLQSFIKTQWFRWSACLSYALFHHHHHLNSPDCTVVEELPPVTWRSPAHHAESISGRFMPDILQHVCTARFLPGKSWGGTWCSRKEPFVCLCDRLTTRCVYLSSRGPFLSLLTVWICQLLHFSDESFC